MKLGTRIFFCYLAIFIICFYYPINWSVKNLRIRYLEGVEDPLVDQANILASIVGSEMEHHTFDKEMFYQAINKAYKRDLSAQIYSLIKTSVDVRIYMTDQNGVITFDSEYKNNEGNSYAHWRDVSNTLLGKYGARTTKKYDNDPFSSVLYVAAPIMINGKIAGVLTVGKPTTNINKYLQKAKPQLVKVGIAAICAAIALSFIVSIWLTQPITRLTRYANDIHAGKRAVFPRLDSSEIGKMGKALQKMQEALEGKRYVEQYVHNLTHEIKSPLSAIRGAAELLGEDMPEDQRIRFLANIRNEANRIQKIIDRMLELSALENKKRLQKVEPVALGPLVKTVYESKRPILSPKGITFKFDVPDNIVIKGDAFLMHQALSNLIQNAIDFSPENSAIELTTQVRDDVIKIVIDDNGPGIPDYALPKVFDKFFSLQRPGSGQKSTGLGLNFVHEVAMLHNGRIVLENRGNSGTRAILTFPL